MLLPRKGENMITFNGYVVLAMSFSMIGLLGYFVWSYTRLEHPSMKALIGMLILNVLVLFALFYVILTHAYSSSPRQSLAVVIWLLLNGAAMTVIYWWTVARVETKEQHISRWISTIFSIIMPIMFVWFSFANGYFHL
jgi:hypothetical protein